MVPLYPKVIMFLKRVPTRMCMAYRYLEHEADVGLEAEGSSLEEAFCEGAKATFNIMVDLREVAQKKKVEIRCEAEGIPSLFVQWLNELLSQADLNGMFFSRFEVRSIAEKAGKYALSGSAWGEGIDPKRHTLKTEAKAATYSGLRYEIKGKKHMLRCVIDV
jgi:SHS2 domain-containing protein